MSYVEEYGLDYDQVDIHALLVQAKEKKKSIFVYDRDDGEYHDISNEDYIKLLLELRRDVEKALEEANK